VRIHDCSAEVKEKEKNETNRKEGKKKNETNPNQRYA